MEACGLDEAVVASTLERLCAEGLLDDFRYGVALCRRLIERGYGPLYIRNVFREKGVEAQCDRILADVENVTDAEPSAFMAIDSAAQTHSERDEEDIWVRRAKAVIRQFERTRWKASVCDNASVWQRAAALLQRRGFN
ncbi:MAG: RecX family transcriptional regulator [Gammaproteobacteria bacterium]